jgi:hypothetical protein
MKFGEWYTEKYSGRKQEFHQLLHVGDDNISVNEWVRDKKTGNFSRVQEHVSIDRRFYQSRIDAEELIPVADEERETLEELVKRAT